ncbi:MAG: hypothetical protein KAG82_06295 [Alcanivoracaceae bacterium]|jgi:hypothetical protein|nr:hypothetical protein [Alcanivoracaceae bacterium]
MRLCRSLLVLLLLSSAGQASSEMLVGYAFVNGISGLNLEWAGQRNTVYAVPGTYLNDEGLSDKWRWVAGFRHRIDRGYTNINGFYTGLMLGDLGGEKRYERLGAGFEIGHQWVKEYTRTTLSAGVAVLEPLDCGDYLAESSCNTQEERDKNDLDAEPGLILSLTISLRR